MPRPKSAKEKRGDREALLRLMLKKAETTTPAEAVLLMERVERLMLELGIEDINSLGAPESKTNVVQIEIPYEGVYAKAWVSMAYQIVMALGEMECLSDNVFKPGTYKKIGLKLIVMGYERDLTRAKILVDSLALQCVTALTHHMASVVRPSWNATDKYNARRSFIQGFGAGAATRIWNTKTHVVVEMTTETPGTDLVLVKRGEIVREAFEEAFPHRRKARRSRVDLGSYADGEFEGRRARTGETEVGGYRAALEG